jgi:hypothetical protein
MEQAMGLADAPSLGPLFNMMKHAPNAQDRK